MISNEKMKGEVFFLLPLVAKMVYGKTPLMLIASATFLTPTM
jgi:hypothetical protein